MDSKSEIDFKLLAGDENSNERKVRTSNSIKSWQQEWMEKLKNNPDVCEIKDQRLLDLATYTEEELDKRNTSLGIAANTKISNYFEATFNYWTKKYGESANSVLGQVDSNTNTILVWNFGMPENVDSKETIISEYSRYLTFFNKAVIIAHEQYHAKAPVIYRSTRTETGTKVDMWRQGLFYPPKDGGVVSCALEEGLAKKWEDEITEKIRKRVPDEAKIYDTYLEFIRETGSKQVPRNVDSSGLLWCVNEQYIDSKTLIVYLGKSVPGFFLHAEKARIDGDLSELAIAVENVFGVGVFGELLNLEDKNALDYCNKLKTKLNKGNTLQKWMGKEKIEKLKS